MKFDFVIGNPPYQDDGDNNNKDYKPPVYDKFMNAAYSVADKVELIHPARFLFNGGSTPKAWNEQMLNDSHFKILEYESNSTKYFNSVSITGGIAISYHDNTQNFGAIKVFSPSKELRSILAKVTSNSSFDSLRNYISIQTRFNLKGLYSDYPEAKSELGSDGRDSRFEKNIFKRVAVFTDKPVTDTDIRTLGISEGRQRVWKYIQPKYVDVSQQANLLSYKVITSVSNGAAGNLGDVPVRIIGDTVLGLPRDGYTRSFIGIGNFGTELEAVNCQTYLRTKFARVMIGIMKSTQMLNPDVWQFVPYQNFSSTSDIDWTVSAPEIDKQLYQKYSLSEEEIAFIENNIKGME